MLLKTIFVYYSFVYFYKYAPCSSSVLSFERGRSFFLLPPIFTIPLQKRKQPITRQMCMGDCGLQGYCDTKSECLKKGGTSSGLCTDATVCCINILKCGTSTSMDIAFFVNPNYPNAYRGGSKCDITVMKSSANICQLGTALAFIVPTLMVKNTTIEEIGNGLQNMNTSIAITSSLVLLLVILFVESEPPKPPSIARMLQIELENKNTLDSIKRLLCRRSFLLVVFSYGLCMGTFNCYATLLSEIFRTYFKGNDGYAGRCGFILSLSGLFGSLCAGYFLDRKRWFKGTSIFVTLCCAICMMVFAYFITIGNIYIIYIVAVIQGFFWMMYYSSGIQMGIEVSYPISEDICAGLMALCIQMHSLIITTLCTYGIRNIGSLEINIGMSILLLISSLLLMMVPSNMKRQQAEHVDITKAADVIKTFL